MDKMIVEQEHNEDARVLSQYYVVVDNYVMYRFHASSITQARTLMRAYTDRGHLVLVVPAAGEQEGACLP